MEEKDKGREIILNIVQLMPKLSDSEKDRLFYFAQGMQCVKDSQEGK